ncbi:HNH endonuclease [Bosea sp. TWI1241]|uniref:HNH endonuclease n=1 Tax=Bosea sp. TWI1241 TaxID=3148904 RepID=UPI00320B6F94
MKAVLDTKPESAYDDEIASRYHFPPRYLGIMSDCVGDWVVFRRPRAAGEGIAYFATGRVTAIVPDHKNVGYNYAMIEDFLKFDKPVAWRADGRYAESALRAMADISQVGLYLRGRSCRELQENDFALIASAGLSDTLDPANAIQLGLDAANVDAATWGILHDPSWPVERRIVAMLINRKIRDANFRHAICRAYSKRCAVTGIRIINGGGRAEVQAAHIVPVDKGGPDTVQNGIALCSTAHWLFDRHLISIDEEYRLLVSRNKIPAELKGLFQPQCERVLLPDDSRLWPSQHYLADHRQQFGSL